MFFVKKEIFRFYGFFLHVGKLSVREVSYFARSLSYVWSKRLRGSETLIRSKEHSEYSYISLADFFLVFFRNKS